MYVPFLPLTDGGTLDRLLIVSELKFHQLCEMLGQLKDRTRGQGLLLSQSLCWALNQTRLCTDRGLLEALSPPLSGFDKPQAESGKCT